MNVWLFLKVLGDLCLYFSVIAAFPFLFPHPFSFLWPILLCAAGVGFASVLACWGKGRARYLALLLPAASMLLCTSLIEVLMLALPVLYAAVIIIRNEMAVEYFDFRAFFLRALAAWIFFFALLAVLCYVDGLAKSASLGLVYAEPLRYGLLYALDSIILLRLLRMGEESQSQDRAMNRTQMIAVMAGTSALLVGFTAVERYLTAQATTLLQFLVYLIGVVIAVPLHLITQLIALLIPDGHKGEPEATEPSTSPTVVIEAPPGDGSVTETPLPADDSYPWWLAVSILIILLSALICMLLILRKRTAVKSTETTTERIAPEKKSKKPSRRTNRGKVRHYYREFLRSETKKGLKLRKDHTSEDILQAIAKDTDPDAAAALRQVYLHARYDKECEVTDEQVAIAKDALARARKN